jgi:hypothetical protein
MAVAKTYLGLVAVLFLLLAAAPPATADEVSESVAYVQSKELEDGGLTMKARIKIKKAGTYVVAGGFAKESGGMIYFHKGLLSGTKYYETKIIRGDAGDVIDVTFRVKVSPPFNRKGHIGIFASEEDIKTKG